MKDFILNIQNKYIEPKVNYEDDYDDEGNDNVNSDNDGSCNKNVIAVDWRAGSQISIYFQAVANTQIVGAIIARFINQLIRIFSNYSKNINLKNNQLSPNNFSLVGHSLGAHVAGFAGAYFDSGNVDVGVYEDNLQKHGKKTKYDNKNQNKIRNIIGLDPAGPGFIDIPTTHRLDPSDAQLVLTIHTNGGSVIEENFGIMAPSGHYSFYPNGGTQQPGCEKTRQLTNILLNGFITGLTDSVSCNHRRSTRLIQINESLFTTAQSMAYSCESYQDFQLGKCGTCNSNGDDDKLNIPRCQPFSGWFSWWQEQTPPNVWKRPIRYFIDTTDLVSLMSLFHFQIILRTKSKFEPISNSYIKITPLGSLRNGKSIILFNTDTGTGFGTSTIQPNTTYTYLMKVPKDLGTIKMALVKVIQRINNNGSFVLFRHQYFEQRSMNPNHIILDLRFNFMSNQNAKVRQQRSSLLVIDDNNNSTKTIMQTSKKNNNNKNRTNNNKNKNKIINEFGFMFVSI